MARLRSESKKDQLKVDKGIHRQIMMDMGMYNIHKEKTHSSKGYSRKTKHKGRGFDD